MIRRCLYPRRPTAVALVVLAVQLTDTAAVWATADAALYLAGAVLLVAQLPAMAYQLWLLFGPPQHPDRTAPRT